MPLYLYWMCIVPFPLARSSGWLRVILLSFLLKSELLVYLFLKLMGLFFVLSGPVFLPALFA